MTVTNWSIKKLPHDVTGWSLYHVQLYNVTTPKNIYPLHLNKYFRFCPI